MGLSQFLLSQHIWFLYGQISFALNGFHTSPIWFQWLCWLGDKLRLNEVIAKVGKDQMAERFYCLKFGLALFCFQRRNLIDRQRRQCACQRTRISGFSTVPIGHLNTGCGSGYIKQQVLSGSCLMSQILFRGYSIESQSLEKYQSIFLFLMRLRIKRLLDFFLIWVHRRTPQKNSWQRSTQQEFSRAPRMINPDFHPCRNQQRVCIVLEFVHTNCSTSATQLFKTDLF